MENPKPGDDPLGAGKLDKKAIAKAKADHDLHVLLIIRQDEISKSKAITIAYAEGAAGLKERLA